ncbi:zinc finger protein 219-like [Sitodiplosis mosellana]|uniref:zinc finger protein 219-like n=1 Tax=Sitodiplosis mosellana TaxID=263140 RepID=UPI002444C61E|nr:zinc finger protein 219-like [Sitodiplosis mosellana]
MPTCRVCRKEKECLISLTLGDGAEHEAHMLSQFIDPNIKYQSSYICLSCTRKLEVTYNFKKQCEKSFAVTQMNQNQAPPNDTTEDECLLVPLDDQDPLIEPMYEENFVNSDTGQSKKFKCHICEKCFCTSWYLTDHIQRHKEKKNQHYCPLCNLKFLTTSLYKKHLSSAH